MGDGAFMCSLYLSANLKTNRSNRGSNNTRNTTMTNTNKPHIEVPYIKGLSESCKKNCREHGIQMHLMGCRTIKDIPVKPIDRSTIWQKIGVIYRYKCGRMDCKKSILGSQAEHLLKDTKNTSKPHHSSTGHDISIGNLALWAGKIKIWQDPSKKPFSSELMTHPLIEIQANTNS